MLCSNLLNLQNNNTDSSFKVVLQKSPCAGGKALTTLKLRSSGRHSFRLPAQINFTTIRRMPVFALVLIAALLGGALPVSVKVGSSALSPLLFVTLRFFIAALTLLPLMSRARRRRLEVAIKNPLVLVAIAANAGTIIFFAFAIPHLSPVLAQILYLLCPLLICVGEAVLFKDKVSFKAVVGIMSGLLGATFAALAYQTSSTPFSSIGFIYMLFAVVCYAIYGLASRHTRTHLGALEQTFAMSIVVCLSATLATMILNEPQKYLVSGLSDSRTLISLLYAGIVGAAIFYALIQEIIRKSDATSASTIIYIQPFTVMLVSFLVLGEALSMQGTLGAVLSILGAYLVTNSSQAKRKAEGVRQS